MVPGFVSRKKEGLDPSYVRLYTDAMDFSRLDLRIPSGGLKCAAGYFEKLPQEGLNFNGEAFVLPDVYRRQIDEKLRVCVLETAEEADSVPQGHRRNYHRAAASILAPFLALAIGCPGDSGSKKSGGGNYTLNLKPYKKQQRGEWGIYEIELTSKKGPIWNWQTAINIGIDDEKGDIDASRLNIRKGYIDKLGVVKLEELNKIERGTLGWAIPLQPQAKELQEKIDEATEKAVKSLEDFKKILKPLGIDVSAEEEQKIKDAETALKKSGLFLGGMETTGFRYVKVGSSEVVIHDRIAAELPVSVIGEPAKLKVVAYTQGEFVIGDFLIDIEGEGTEETKTATKKTEKWFNLEIESPKKAEQGERVNVYVQLSSTQSLVDTIFVAGIDGYLGDIIAGDIKAEKKISDKTGKTGYVWLPANYTNCQNPGRFLQASPQDQKIEESVSDPVLRKRVEKALLQKRMELSGVPVLVERSGIFVRFLEGLPLWFASDQTENTGIIHNDLAVDRKDDCYGVRWKIPVKIDEKISGRGKFAAHTSIHPGPSLSREADIEVQKKPKGTVLIPKPDTHVKKGEEKPKSRKNSAREHPLWYGLVEGRSVSYADERGKWWVYFDVPFDFVLGLTKDWREGGRMEHAIELTSRKPDLEKIVYYSRIIRDKEGDILDLRSYGDLSGNRDWQVMEGVNAGLLGVSAPFPTDEYKVKQSPALEKHNNPSALSKDGLELVETIKHHRPFSSMFDDSESTGFLYFDAKDRFDRKGIAGLRIELPVNIMPKATDTEFGEMESVVVVQTVDGRRYCLEMNWGTIAGGLVKER